MEYFNAFLLGGILCVIGQVLLDRTSLTPARILVFYVVAGVILSGPGGLGGGRGHRPPHRIRPHPGPGGAQSRGGGGLAGSAHRRAHRHRWGYRPGHHPGSCGIFPVSAPAQEVNFHVSAIDKASGVKI